MEDNEKIIASQLLEIKNNLENRDIAKVYQLCDELKMNVKKYSINKAITPRINTIADIAQPSTSNLTLNDRIREIDDIIDILNSA